MYIIQLLFLVIFSFLSFADSNHHIRSDAHAPISVMGDHTHSKGEVMVSYRYMRMPMAGVLNGIIDVSFASYNGDTSYMAYLQSMDMDMHMLGGMFATSDKLTLMLMVPYHINNMVVKSKMGGALSSMASEGLGDVKAGGLLSLVDDELIKSHLFLSVSFPTGAIDLTKSNPVMVLGYPMQLGSGTVDFKSSWTWTRYFDQFSIGSQLNALFRLGENSQGYRLGNVYNAIVWAAFKFLHYSVSTSLNYTLNDSIYGQHKGISSTMNASQDASNSGSQLLTVGFGVNVILYKGYRVAVEYLIPVHYYVTGYQMALEPSVVVGIQKAF